MLDQYWKFHLFGATFSSQAQARHYAFEQWEPAPAEPVSDAQYRAWEDRNPSWRLAEELGFYMDADFVELVDDFGYVQAQIRSESERLALAARGCGFSHYILVGEHAICGDRQSPSDDAVKRLPQSTATVQYLGQYNES